MPKDKNSISHHPHSIDNVREVSKPQLTRKEIKKTNQTCYHLKEKQKKRLWKPWKSEKWNFF